MAYLGNKLTTVNFKDEGTIVAKSAATFDDIVAPLVETAEAVEAKNSESATV